MDWSRKKPTKPKQPFEQLSGAYATITYIQRKHPTSIFYRIGKIY
jgi:hypothetical protein